MPRRRSRPVRACVRRSAGRGPRRAAARRRAASRWRPRRRSRRPRCRRRPRAANSPGPVCGEPAARDRVQAARDCAAASTIAPARWSGATTRSTVPGWSRKRLSTSRRVSSSTSSPSQPSASAVTSSFHSGVEPTEVSRARRAAAISNARAIASSSAPGAERLDHEQVAAGLVVHARDAPGEVELGPHAVERRVVGRGDEDRVGVPVGLARRERQRVAEARQRLAAERQVDVVDAQRVHPRDGGERARGLAHQLGPDAVAGEARDRPAAVRSRSLPARSVERRYPTLAPVVCAECAWRTSPVLRSASAASRAA